MRHTLLRPAQALALAGMLAVGGCASSLSESQCLANDWETIGYRDGLSGTQSTALMRHMDACMKHGVSPDRESYLAGWRDGVEQYCQPGNGFAAGERGAGYANVCPAHLERAFHAAYQDGRQLYLAQQDVNEVVRAIDHREARLREVKAELAAIAGAMVDGESTAAERTEMLLTAKDLAQEQGQINAEIRDLREDLAMKSQRLEDLRHTLAFAG